jgi:YegS/Rv2252/BmrU family lipid kinase
MGKAQQRGLPGARPAAAVPSLSERINARSQSSDSGGGRAREVEAIRSTMNAPWPKALLIVNAKSRSGDELLELAKAGLDAQGIEPLYRDCAAREDLSPTIIREGQEVDFVVVGGGDGTISAAARGVMTLGKPLGILPTGTANDLARTLGIPTELEAAIATIANGHTRRIDIGFVNEQPFFNVASIGLSAELALELTKDIKRRFGRLGYAFVAIKVLLRARPFRAVITSGDKNVVRVGTLQVAVGNGRFYGGGNAVESTAEIDDRRLDLYSLEVKRAWTLALMARSFRAGEHGAWEEVRAVRAKAFEIRTRRPRPVNADGEIVTETPARFTLQPSAVEVFAPAPSTVADSPQPRASGEA